MVRGLQIELDPVAYLVFPVLFGGMGLYTVMEIYDHIYIAKQGAATTSVTEPNKKHFKKQKNKKNNINTLDKVKKRN